jgi:hypothetical protein
MCLSLRASVTHFERLDRPRDLGLPTPKQSRGYITPHDRLGDRPQIPTPADDNRHTVYWFRFSCTPEGRNWLRQRD